MLKVDLRFLGDNRDFLTGSPVLRLVSPPNRESAKVHSTLSSHKPHFQPVSTFELDFSTLQSLSLLLPGSPPIQVQASITAMAHGFGSVVGDIGGKLRLNYNQTN